MDKVVDFAMTKLFHLAEYVCSKTVIKRVESDACIGSPECEQTRLIIKCSPVVDEPATKQEVVPTIRFTNEDKTAIKRVESNACISSFERKQSRLKIKMVEGDLFK